MGNNTKAVSSEGVGRNSQTFIITTAFLSMLAIVGFAYYGVPFYFDFMMKDYFLIRIYLPVIFEFMIVEPSGVKNTSPFFFCNTLLESRYSKSR